MATSRLDSVFQQLRRVVLMRDGAGLTDAQLLELFISQKDHAAFEALVRRHGTMVLKVCHRVIRNHHDAEDAYQATFLILALKAASVKPRERVANWLHGVAFRTALNARKLAAKRQGRERQMIAMPEHLAMPIGPCHDLQPLLDQELSRLAEIYRLPILLCDMEGKSIKRTAQQLGWPQGTVAGRLARGRKLLAKRLARHGLAMTGGIVLLQSSASACVPPSLVAATVKAASAYAVGKSAAAGLISANVAILMEGVLTTMFLTKLKIATAVLVLGSIFALGGVVLKNGTAGGEQEIEARKGGNEKPVIHQAEQSKDRVEAGKKDPATPKTDHEKLRGTWKVVEWYSHGKKDTTPPKGTWWIGKDKIVTDPPFLSATQSPKGRQYASYHFWGDNSDATPSPNNINITVQLDFEMPDANQSYTKALTLRGIYALDGNKLTFCLCLPASGNRPTEIPASFSKKENLLIVVLQRETPVLKTDEEKLQGDWNTVDLQEDGERVDLSKDSPLTSFVGDLVIDSQDEDGAIFNLDSTKSPKQITASYKSGNVERKITGIYSLDGDDLKICYGKDEKDAIPGDFTAAKGSGRQVTIFKRVKAAGEGATSSQPHRPEGGSARQQQEVPAGEGAAPDAWASNDKKTAISVDVVIEEVDLSANTINARATSYVVPPHGNVGGAVFMTGTTDSKKDQATKFVRLPVMPEANIKDKKLKAGLHAIIQLQMMRNGSLVVVGIAEFTGVERIGVDKLDAPPRAQPVGR